MQQAVEKTGVPIKLVAQRAGYKRVTYYLHRKTEDLSLDILAKYSRAIGHDFSEEIPGMKHFIVEDEGVIYHNEPSTIEEAIKQRNEWKEKYYALMEKYHKYIEEISK